MAKLYSSITFGADAWVNTGIIPNLNTRAELYNVSLANNIYYYCIMGSENSDGSPYTFRIRTVYNTDTIEFNFGNGGTPVLNGLLPFTNADIIADKNTFQVDNNSYSFNTTTIINNYPVYLGADNRGGNAVDAKGGLTIGEFKLYKDGVLVCDLFPAKDNNDVICLYDSVSETYKYNGGNGTLTLGEPLKLFSIDPDSETVSVDGSSFSVDITSENPWTASTTDSWVTLSSMTGLTDATITVTVTDNYNKSQRVGTVTFTDGEDTLTLTITQKSDTRLLLKNIYRNGNSVKAMFRSGQKIYQQLFKLIFSVDTDEIIFENSGGTYTINITANERWTMTVPSWLTASSLSGTGSASIILSTNSVPDSKLEGEIIINCLNKSYTIDVLQKGVGPDLSQPLTIEVVSGGDIYFLYHSYRTPNVTFNYSINDSDWTEIVPYNGYTSTNRITVNTGDIIKIKGSNTGRLSTSSSLYYHIEMLTGLCNISGNIMSLLYDSFVSKSTINNYEFYGLFQSSKVVDASGLILPAITLTERCYWGMFTNCSNLTAAPELPATTLTNYCYSSMFYGCTSLTTAPDLPATTLANYCYHYMFRMANNLNYIKCLATDISATYCTLGWLENTASTGTFVKAAGVTWPTGTSGIPSGWTIIDV